MGKNLKKSLAVTLCLVMMVASVPLGGFVGIDLSGWLEVFEASAIDVVASGTCGYNLNWTLDDDGVLTISGTGAMWDQGAEECHNWRTYCDDIKVIKIEYGATNIGNYAFCSDYYSCTNLTTVIIPESVTSIGSYAFRGCTSLTSITIPDSVTSIGYCAFSSCTKLENIEIDIHNQYYASEDGVIFNKDKTELIQYPLGKSNTSYTIPDSVTSIGSYAFFGCTSLTSITIPDSVTSIGSYAFYGCTSLTSITIPDSVTSIGNYAFYYCTSLTSITIPDSVTSIGNYAFYYTAWYNSQSDGVIYLNNWVIDYKGDMLGNTNISLKSGTVGISDYAFCYCKSLTSITIPDSVTSIGSYAFYDCTSLTSITIPDSVTSIGRYAFYNTSWYNNQSDGVVYLNDWAIDYKGDMPENTSISLKSGTVGIADSAFNWCTSLTSITIPDSVTSIGSYAFYGCTSLTSITIPDSVTSIGNYAFYYCTSLTNITIPDSVTSIGSYAFRYCTSLDTVYYSGTEDEWNEISIDYDNSCLTSAEIIFLGEEETPTDPCADGHTTYTSKEAVEPTCTTDGSTEEISCSVCNTVTTANETINAFGHTYYTSKEAVEETCTTDGSTAEISCSVCSTVTTESEIITATGHDYGSWVTTTESTATTKGVQTATCSICGDTKTQELDYIAPTSVEEITVTNGSTWLTLNWKADPGATGYQIYMNDTKIATLYDGETTYTVTSLSGATDYEFSIRSFSKATGSTVFGSYSKTYTFTTNPLKASFASYSSTLDAIRVNWNAVEGADGYRIYQLIDGKWVSLATVSSSTLTYRVSGLDEDTEYSFKVKAYTRDVEKVAQFGVASNEYVASTKSTQVSMTTYSNTTSAIRINWTEVSTADGYRVYQYIDGKWKTIATIQDGDTTTYRISGLDDGTIYKFKVKAFIRNSSGTAVWQESSDTFTTMTDLATVKITSSSKTSSAIRLNWNEVDGATGYKVYIYVDGAWKTYATIYDGETTTYRLSGLDSNTKYKFKVQAFSKETGSTVWGAKCTTYSVTTSK